METGAEEGLPVVQVELDEFQGFSYEPLVDEPVTGSGNDDLWARDCDPAREACPVSSPGNAPPPPGAS